MASRGQYISHPARNPHPRDRFSPTPTLRAAGLMFLRSCYSDHVHHPNRSIWLVPVLYVLLSAFAARAMDMPHYDLDSLVYLSTDIVLATLSVDSQRRFTATVTEPLHGALHAGDRLETLSPFLSFFQPME